LAAWIGATVARRAGTRGGVLPLAVAGPITEVVDFWPEPYKRPAGRNCFVELGWRKPATILVRLNHQSGGDIERTLREAKNDQEVSPNAFTTIRRALSAARDATVHYRQITRLRPGLIVLLSLA
jgi:hypothetical protein